jgi:hypothetical protein
MLKSGTKLKDNDPRVPEGTVVEVIHGDVDPLVCQRGPRIVRISAKRIYTDGKPRRTGFSVIPETST